MMRFKLFTRDNILPCNQFTEKYRRNWEEHIDRIPKRDSKVMEGSCFVISVKGLNRPNTGMAVDDDTHLHHSHNNA
jgi:hypothetical protein